MCIDKSYQTYNNDSAINKSTLDSETLEKEKIGGLLFIPIVILVISALNEVDFLFEVMINWGRYRFLLEDIYGLIYAFNAYSHVGLIWFILYSLYLVCKKDKKTSKVMVKLLLTYNITYFFLYIINLKPFDVPALKSIVIWSFSIIVGIFWIPYFYFSKRVRRTFVNSSGSSTAMVIENKKNDLPEEVRMKIENGWIAGIVSAVLTVVTCIILINSLYYSGKIDIVASIDVVFTLVLSYGIYKKNKVASISMFLYSFVAGIVCVVATGQIMNLLIGIPFLYFYYNAIVGVYQYHNFRTPDIRHYIC